jgi:hypothetical protein
MDFTPQVETREISDSDLDNVSGGLLGPVSGVLGTVTSAAAPVTGIVSDVTGVDVNSLTSGL